MPTGWTGMFRMSRGEHGGLSGGGRGCSMITSLQQYTILYILQRYTISH